MCADAKTISVLMTGRASPLDESSDDDVRTVIFTIYSQSHFSQTFGSTCPYPPIMKIEGGELRAVTKFEELENNETYMGNQDRMSLRVESVENYILRQNTDFEKVVREAYICPDFIVF